MSLFRRYFILLAAVTIACIFVLMSISVISAADYMRDEKKSVLIETGDTVAQMAAYRLDADDYEYSISSIASVVGSAINASIYVTDKEGNITVCNCNEYLNDCSNIFRYGIPARAQCSHTQKSLSTDVLSRIGNGNFFEISDLGGIFASKQYNAAIELQTRDNRLSGYVIVSSPASDLNEFNNDMIRIFLLSSLIPILILIIAFYFANYRVSRPLRLMSEAAKSITKGDFSKRIPVETDDEIGELAVSFNNMTNSLVQLESMRRSFVANVSHELKTPMTTIGGFIDGILDGTIPKEKHSYYLGIVSDEVKRLSRLVGGMLSMSKLESGEMKINRSSFDLSEVICTSVLSLEQRIEEKNIEIKGLDELAEIRISADKDLLHQVVYNLSDNAVKFTDEGGCISFTAGKAENGSIFFNIRNTGEGISARDLPHVFERFYKTDRSRSKDKTGTGLGLYIVKTIIDIHGGKITLSSVEGEYTEFSVTLPSGTDIGSLRD